MRRNARVGVIASVSASVMFGLTTLLTAALAPLTAEQVTSWRIVCIIVLMAVFFTFTRRWDDLVALLRRFRAHPVAGLLVLLFCSGIVTSQLWVFIWGAMHGHALDVSLGYFLMPLMMVLVGRVIFHDQINIWQLGAVVCAFVAVGLQVVFSGGISWVTAMIGFVYPVYFAMRRAWRLDDVTMFWLEMIVASPLAVFVLITPQVGAVLSQVGSGVWWSLLVLGVLSGVAMMAYILASTQLSLTVFGLLSYLEPMLLFVAALLLGERPTPADIAVYGLIAVALVLLGISATRRSLPGEPAH
ncbi:EamA family transporter RarD [Pseudoclavibacter soli]|uniref:EamA family transporter RarD n=1 Tax=Pseudoclavibacter soli TaxID=452623 RepID=UPI00040256C3|nr:EamA family transporter RarD [Pseudoclavibacter soli]